MPKTKRYRPDMDGAFQHEYQKARRQLLASSDVPICALCGKPIDKRLKFPHPLSASVDHIIPIAKGGHPSDLSNLQLAHLICNQQKGSRQVIENNKELAKESAFISNRVLPQTRNWLTYRSSQ